MLKLGINYKGEKNMKNKRYVIYQGTCRNSDGSGVDASREATISTKRKAIAAFNTLKKDIYGWTSNYVYTSLELETYNSEEDEWESVDIIEYDIRKTIKKY